MAGVVSGALDTIANATSNTGAYPITQGTLTVSPNYSLTFTPGTLTVTKAGLQVVADISRAPMARPTRP